MTPKFTPYSRVKLVSGGYAGENAHHGMIGYIIELYPDGNYEVEFSDPTTGFTLAQVVVGPEDIVLAPDVEGSP